MNTMPKFESLDFSNQFQESSGTALLFHAFLASVFLYLCFWIVRAFYRVYLHPLSRYPGPLAAAFSKPWYEWYWNYYQKGQLIFEIEKQHAKLGPVVRIAPNELHINDPDVFQDMTKVGSRFTKDPSFYDFITFPNTSIGETDPVKHRIRRLVLTPAFSPTRVQELAPMVKENVDLLLQRFESFAENGSPVNIFTSTKAFTMDVISKIVFGKELGCIQEPDFRNQFIEYLHDTFEMGWPATTFPNLTRLSLSLPDWIADRLFPIPLMEFKKKCIKLIEDYLNDRNVPIVGKTGKQARKNEFNKSVVIDTLVDPSSAKDHSVLNASELAEEVIMLLSAGNDTTSNAMISGIYQILRSPEVYKRLNDELMVNFPMLENEITYERAKTLPYLSAVIKEILRYSSPLPARLPRVVPPEGYNLYGHHVPPSTIMVTSCYLLNRHESCWPNPDQFSPDRWLNNDSARLDKYMTSFYRGTRQCLGKDLALCEMYVLLGNLFRKFELEIYNTTDEDMKWIDLLLIFFTGKNLEVMLEKRTS